jgi:hypothetical protein
MTSAYHINTKAHNITKEIRHVTKLDLNENDRESLRRMSRK